MLNRPLERAPGGDFRYPLASPDGEHVVYYADPEGDRSFVLKSCTTSGKTAPVTLDGLGLYGFTLDGRRCLVTDDVDSDGASEIALVPIAGGGAPQVLDELAVGGYAGGFVFTDDRLHLLYLADRDTRDVFELFRVSLSGGPSVRLNAPLPAGHVVNGFRLSPDQSRAVYSEGSTYSSVAISAVPVDGSGAALPLPIALGPDRSIRGWDLDSGGTRVLYVADQDEDEVYELHTIAADGSQPPQRLSALLAPGLDVGSFWQPDPGRVLYTVTDPQIDVWGSFGVIEVYGVPIDGSQAPMLFASANDVLLVLPVGERLVFAVRDPSDPSSTRLLSAPIDAPAPLRDISGPLSRFFHLQAGRDSRLVLFTAEPTSAGPGEIFSVAVDGSSPPVRLNPPLLPGGSVRVVRVDAYPAYWETSAGVLFTASQGANEPAELYLTPTDGSTPARKLTHGPVRELFPAISPLPWWTSGAGAADFGRALFVGNGSFQSMDLDAGSKLVTLEAGTRSSVVGRVQSFDLSPAGDRALYVASEDADETVELQLYSVRTGKDPERARIPVDPLDNLVAVRLSPDGSRAVFSVLRGAELHLHGVAAEGGVPVRLSGPGDALVDGFHFSPDGVRLVYFALLGTRMELFSVPLDGSAPSIHLSATLPEAVFPEGVAFSADGGRLAFRSSARELYTVPADGSLPAVHIATTHEVEGDVSLSSDGARVVFRTNPVGGRRGELYSAASDGSAPPMRLNGPLPTGNDVQAFAVAHDADRAFYLAGQDTPGVVELYTTPTDGSSPPVRMHAPLSGGRDIADLRLSADERWVVFRADFIVDNQVELFAVPVDLGRAPVRLSGALVAAGDVLEYAITPDSRRVVYRADASIDGREELFTVPIGGARSPVRLRSPAQPSGRVHSFRISADSRSVAFIADRPEAQRCSLVTVGVEGGKAVELTGPFLFQAFSPLFEYDLGPDGRSAAYLSSPESGVDLRLARAEALAPLARVRLR